MVKHRTGSKNAGGSPREVAVFVSLSSCLPTTRGLFEDLFICYTYSKPQFISRHTRVSDFTNHFVKLIGFDSFICILLEVEETEHEEIRVKYARLNVPSTATSLYPGCFNSLAFKCINIHCSSKWLLFLPLYLTPFKQPRPISHELIKVLDWA